MTDDQSERIRSSIRLSFGATLSTGILQFGSMIILARLVSPEQYGVYALCLALSALVTALVNNVIERGLVVQPEEQFARIENDTTTILLFSSTAAIFTFCVGTLMRELGLYSLDRDVLAIILAGHVVRSVAIVPSVTLRREIQFGNVLAAELSGLVVGTIFVAIGLAAIGWGPHALAAGFLAQSIVFTLFLRLRCPMAAWTSPSWNRMVRLVRVSLAAGKVAATEIANGQIPALLLGSFLPPSSLGLFNRGYSIVQMPIQLLVTSISRVMVSALFAVRNDRLLLRGRLRSLIEVSAVVITPLAAGMAGASQSFVEVMLGPNWSEAAGFLPFLALASWAAMIGSAFGVLAESMREFTRKARLQIVSTGVLAVLMGAGALHGLESAIAGMAISSCFFLLAYAHLAAKLLEQPIRNLLLWLLPGLTVALPCFLASWGIGRTVVGSPLLILFFQIAACGLLQASVLLFVFPRISLKIIEGSVPWILHFLPPLDNYLREPRKFVSEFFR